MGVSKLLKALSYPRSILLGVVALLWTLFWSALTVIGALFFKGKWWGDFITRTWARGLLAFFNIKLSVRGRENLVAEGCLFTFNHTSHFDIPIAICALKDRTIRFGAKAELFKIPFFGAAIKSIGVLEIHRSKRDQVLELYKKSLVNLSKGYNYILAPEGTRQFTGKLGTFKSGPFIMAVSGQCPVVPVVIHGAYKIMPKQTVVPAWGIWAPEVVVEILPAVESQGMTLDQRPELQEKVRRAMDKALLSSSI